MTAGFVQGVGKKFWTQKFIMKKKFEAKNFYGTEKNWQEKYSVENLKEEVS